MRKDLNLLEKRRQKGDKLNGLIRITGKISKVDGDKIIITIHIIESIIIIIIRGSMAQNLSIIKG